jgi:hypothetical protein
MEPQPDRKKVAITAKMAKRRNVIEFIPQVYWILDTKLRTGKCLLNEE